MNDFVDFSSFNATGPNAIRALEELGILDAVLAKAEEEKPDVRPFRYIRGTGEHEFICDVSIRAYMLLDSIFNLTLTVLRASYVVRNQSRRCGVRHLSAGFP